MFHLADVHRLGEDPGLVFGLQLVQKGSEQNAEGGQLHFQESFLLFDLRPDTKLNFNVKPRPPARPADWQKGSDGCAPTATSSLLSFSRLRMSSSSSRARSRSWRRRCHSFSCSLSARLSSSFWPFGGKAKTENERNARQSPLLFMLFTNNFASYQKGTFQNQRTFSS